MRESARAAITCRYAPCKLAASEWLRKKHDVFDTARCPSADDVKSRLAMLVGASKDAGGPDRVAHRKAQNSPSFAEMREIKESLQALLPSLARVNIVEVDEQKANGRLIRLEPSSGALYIHPDLFKAGLAGGTATVHAMMLASSFAATLTGTAGQGVWATYHCLPSLILQTSSDPLAHIKQIARTFSYLKGQGWDVAPLASYWDEVSESMKYDHAIGASSGALSPWAPVFSPGAARSLALHSQNGRFSESVMTRLRELTGKTQPEIDTLLINYNIYKSRENPFFSKGFVNEGEQYVNKFLRRCELQPGKVSELASTMLAEGMKTVSSPLRQYVGKISGESETLLSEVDKLEGAWPTQREHAEFLKHPQSDAIDPELKKLMLHAHRAWRDVSLGDLLALHPGNELLEYPPLARSQSERKPFFPTDPTGKAYQAIPAALRLLGREGFDALVTELPPIERIKAFAYMTCLPRYHEGLITPFKEEALLFEEKFTGELSRDLSSVAKDRVVIDIFLKKLIPRPKGVDKIVHEPPTEAFWRGLERFGFLGTGNSELILNYGSRVRALTTRSALNALSCSQDPLVRACAYDALTAYGVEVNITPAFAGAFAELSKEPPAVADTATFRTLEAAARLLAVRTTAKDLDLFFNLCDQKRCDGAVADYLVAGLSDAFISRGEQRALKQLIASNGKSSAITDSTWCRILQSDNAQGGVAALSLEQVKALVESTTLSAATRARARELIGETRLREVLGSVDSSVGQRVLEGARDSEITSLLGADANTHNGRAVLVRRVYKDAAKSTQRWIKDNYTDERKLNYYAILGLPFGANPDQIKFSFRLLAASFHSDRISDENDKQVADRQMREINEAYSVLSKDEKRVEYDAMILRNQIQNRHGCLPKKPWYTAPTMRPLELSPPESTYYTARPELRMPRIEPKKLLGPASL